MKTFCVILCLSMFTTVSHGQTGGLFVYLDEARTGLTDRQEHVLRMIHERTYTTQVHLIAINDAHETGGRSNVLLNFPAGRAMAVKRTSISVSRLNDTGVLWTGATEDPASSIKFSIWGDDLLGQVRTSNLNFLVEPLGDGLHALIEIDPEKFKQEEPPREVDEIEANSDESEEYSPDVSSHQSAPEIRVLVAYTANARDNFGGDINQLIEMAADYANYSFALSNVSASINVVHTIQVYYNESSNNDLNLCRLTTSSIFIPSSSACAVFSSNQLEGYMDAVHTSRYQHDANLVVLITGSGGAGVGWMGRTISATYAFSIARYDYAAANYTFAHEIGHNIGSDHDVASIDDPENSPYTYGHGYRNAPLSWHTIMSYGPHGQRINYWSSPNRTLGGVPMGSVQYEDNTRLWNERASAIANLAPPFQPPPPLTASVSGTGALIAGHTGHWTATSTGGTGGNRTFRWYIGPQPAGPFTLHRTHTTSQSNDNFSYQAQTGMTDFRLRVAVERGGDSAMDEMDVSIHDTGGCPTPLIYCLTATAAPEAFDLDANYPNPFTSSTEIRFALPEAASISLVVVDLLGREVARLVDGPRSAGYHRARVDGSRWAGGVYLYRIDTTGASGERFTRSGRMTLMR